MDDQIYALVDNLQMGIIEGSPIDGESRIKESHESDSDFIMDDPQGSDGGSSAVEAVSVTPVFDSDDLDSCDHDGTPGVKSMYQDFKTDRKTETEFWCLERYCRQKGIAGTATTTSEASLRFKLWIREKSRNQSHQSPNLFPPLTFPHVRFYLANGCVKGRYKGRNDRDCQCRQQFLRYHYGHHRF